MKPELHVYTNPELKKYLMQNDEYFLRFEIAVSLLEANNNCQIRHDLTFVLIASYKHLLLEQSTSLREQESK